MVYLYTLMPDIFFLLLLLVVHYPHYKNGFLISKKGAVIRIFSPPEVEEKRVKFRDHGWRVVSIIIYWKGTDTVAIKQKRISPQMNGDSIF